MRILQPAMSKGEISPQLHSRVDKDFYLTSLATCLNAFVQVQGGASNRAGFEYVGETKSQDKKVRLIPFQYNTTQGYALEFGEQYMRVVNHGAYVLEASTSKAITGATQALNCELTVTGHGLSTGDMVYVAAVVGMTELNARFFTITVTGANTFTIGVDSTSYTAYSSGGTSARVYTITTPYLASDLYKLTYTQTADVLWLSCKGYPRKKLSRTAHDEWTLTEIDGKPPGMPDGSTLNVLRMKETSSSWATIKLSAAHGLANGTSIPVFVSGFTDGPVALNGNVIELKYISWFCGLDEVYVSLSDTSLLGTKITTIDTSVVPVEVTFAVDPVVNAGAAAADFDVSYFGGVMSVPSMDGQVYKLKKLTSTKVALYDQSTGLVPVDGTAWSVTSGENGKAYILRDDATGTPGTHAGPPDFLEVGVTNLDFTPTTSGSVNTKLRYKVTVVFPDGRESLPASTAEKTSKALDAANSSKWATVFWDAVQGAKYYNVYKEAGGSFGWIGRADPTSTSTTSGTLQFYDKNIAPALSDGPPSYNNPFSDNNDPGAIGFHDQRIVYANTTQHQSGFYLSSSNGFTEFNQAIPLNPDDAIIGELATANEIRHIVSLRDLLVLTQGGEWKFGIGSGDVLTPLNIFPKEESRWGTSFVRPVYVGTSAIFVVDGGKMVRDLFYYYDVSASDPDSYKGSELSVLSKHMFEDAQIIEADYAKLPDAVVWYVLSNGKMVGLTYHREHKVVAWHRHETDGKVESVCTVLENGEHRVYIVVKRKIQGVWMKYTERLHQRDFLDIKDAFIVDSGLSYDVPIQIESIDKTVVPIRLTATGHPFVNGDYVDIDDVEAMTELNGGRYKVVGKTANTFDLTDELDVNVDGTTFDDAEPNTGQARKCVTTIGGLWHLEGRTVAALANGNVEPPHVVTNGQITLQYRASRIHSGLPYVTDIQTLDFDILGQQQILGVKRRVPKLFVRVYKTRGLWMGPDFNHLTEYPQRTTEPYGQPIQPFTGVLEMAIDNQWKASGQVAIRQTDPLPVTVQSVIPEIELGV